MLAWFQVSGIQAQMDMPQVESICFPMNAPSRRSNKNKYFGSSEQDRFLEYLWFRLEMWLQQAEVASEICSVESEKTIVFSLSLSVLSCGYALSSLIRFMRITVYIFMLLGSL